MPAFCFPLNLTTMHRTMAKLVTMSSTMCIARVDHQYANAIQNSNRLKNQDIYIKKIIQINEAAT
jgi:hypothetical protein